MSTDRSKYWRVTLLVVAVFFFASACSETNDPLSVTPRSLRDVPADRLAFRFEADTNVDTLPERLRTAEAEQPLASVKRDFEGRRGNSEDLKRTVLDPTGQRVLALYGTSETDTDFKIDLYSVEGQFIRNVLPTDLTGVFPSEVAWSPDGQSMAFIGVRNPALTASPTPPPDAISPFDESAPPPVTDPSMPTPTPVPIIPPVQSFKTEQVYIGNRDGFDLRPLTLREGLIYFRLAWSPNSKAIAALACKEDEWEARRSTDRSPAGRPRTITLEGQERLLDDRLTDVAPSWSPDASKVATAYDFDVTIYDFAGNTPTGAAISLRAALEAASSEYEARLYKSQNDADKPTNVSAKSAAATPTAQTRVLNSLNPVVRVEWIEPETLLAQTAFVRFYRNEPAPVTTYPRWHVLKLFAQAAVVK